MLTEEDNINTEEEEEEEERDEDVEETSAALEGETSNANNASNITVTTHVGEDGDLHMAATVRANGGQSSNDHQAINGIVSQLLLGLPEHIQKKLQVVPAVMDRMKEHLIEEITPIAQAGQVVTPDVRNINF